MTLLLTSLAMIAFAANSVLGRAALLHDETDPASFAALRLGSGALALWLLVYVRRQAVLGSWLSAVWLLCYALPFSFAYLQLASGTGALILFALVQATMILAGVLAGERPAVGQWFGIACAGGGLVFLLLPGLRAPEPVGALLMAVAGVAWGVYSLRGKRVGAPLSETAGNFLRATVLAAVVVPPLLLLRGDFHVSVEGLELAIASGALTSGLGYALWYGVLPKLSATTAAAVQLTVPVIAAALGALLLAEAVSMRLMVASLLILGGVFLVVRR